MINLSTVVKGFKTSEFAIVLVVVLGVDLDSAVAIYSSLPDELRVLGELPDITKVKAMATALQGQDWKELMVKALLAGAYIWGRDRHKSRGFEIEKLKIQ